MSDPMKLGWAFFGLCCVVVLACGLNRGMYVGSATGLDLKTMPVTYPWAKKCFYLYPSGISGRSVDWGATRGILET